ncbi:alpha/beta hydrolase family protein [Luteimonas huabeiensis]|uniref:alpha/beta hydrolase family protein n=1 Tax=Luteimonas huabeiensis TaxID=1244513 RepID=UPI000464E5A5|nr:S9 family peptidase [Luteimonas huabeiensis]
MGWLARLALIGLAFAWACPARAQVDLAPFVAEDEFGSLKVSPTGEYYAATVPVDGQYGLVILRREDRAITASFRFTRGTSVHDFWWVNPERVLIAVSETFGSRDDPLPTGELYAMNADGSRRDLLVGWRVQNQRVGTNIISSKREGQVAASLVDTLPEDDRNVLIAVRPLVNDPAWRVERMDVYSGRRTRVASAPVTRADFVTDQHGVVRFAYGANTDNVLRTYLRDGDDAEWRLINDEGASGRRMVPLGFSADNAIAYLRLEHAEGPDSVVALDIASGQQREVVRDAIVDPLPIYDHRGRTPVGARFLGPRPRTVYFEPDSPDGRLLRSIEAAFPGQTVLVSSATADGRHKLLWVGSDVDPGSYYAFDSERKSAEFILARSRGIDPGKMAKMRPVEVRARDGLTLHGFLTVPQGSDGRGLPMVVLPHGGPYGIFDAWGYDTETQLLAAAGYAVLRVNFRGSGNYGRAFLHAGAQQWGGAMQDDLTDATRWAIAEGIADPQRICIYGGSYGGYAALMGVAREPGLYRCAVGYVGVYDLPRMRQENHREGRSARTWTRDWIGTDTAALAAASPTRLAGRIRAPVLLAAGGEDLVAPIEHSRAMERALKAADVPVETLYYPDEGHGFYTAEHREGFYRRLLDFLHRHIGGAVAAP